MEFNGNGIIFVKSSKMVILMEFTEIPHFGLQKHLANLWNSLGLIYVSTRGLQNPRFH